jgi:transcriptional regulator with XRE-family HTH domain
MSPMNVGECIRQLRLSIGMLARALAAKTGFSPSLISQVEHGQVMPSIGSLEHIAMALGGTLGKCNCSTWVEEGTHGRKRFLDCLKR